MPSVIEAATKIAERFGVLSNPYRTVILAFLLERKKATWSDIKHFIEKSNMGTINPNTLQFHLKALISAGMVSRSGSENNVVYSIGDIPAEISATLDKEIVKILKDFSGD